MKTKLLILILFISVNSFSQKIVSTDIYQQFTPYESLIMSVFGKDTTMSFIAQNSKYEYISQPITIYRGSPTELMYFFIQLNVFFMTNVKGTTDKIDDHVVNLYENSLSVWDLKMRGYHDLSKNQVKKLQKKLKAFCEKNKIQYQ